MCCILCAQNVLHSQQAASTKIFRSYLKNSDPHRLEKNTLKTVFFKNILPLPHGDFNLHFIVSVRLAYRKLTFLDIGNGCASAVSHGSTSYVTRA